MGSHVDHAPWHRKHRETLLPAYLEHPRTGVRVEVTEVEVTTVYGMSRGEPRMFRDMRESTTQHIGIWSALDEVALLLKHGWRPL